MVVSLCKLYMRGGPPKPWNYLLEGGPLVVQASPTTWVFWETICYGVSAGGVVRGCVWSQWLVFGDSTSLPISWQVIMSAPAHTALSVQQFLIKNGMTSVPHPPYIPDLTLRDFFVCVSLGEKNPQRGNVLPMWKKWNKKWQKHYKATKFKNCFEWWRKGLHRCVTSNGEYSEGDWSLNMLRINTRFFKINSGFLGSPPLLS